MAYRIWVLTTENQDPQPSVLDHLRWTAVCGLGAVAFLRTKLVNVQGADGKNMVLGPEIIIRTFLKVIDHEFDREPVNDRFELVRNLMENFDFEKAKIRLPIRIFQAMQGLSEEESQTLMDRIEEVEGMDMLDSQAKSYFLGFYLLDLVGEKFLTDLFNKY